MLEKNWPDDRFIRKLKVHCTACVKNWLQSLSVNLLIGLSFYGFENMKIFLLERWPDVFGKPCPQNDGKLVLIIPAKLLCGGIAGAFAQTVS